MEWFRGSLRNHMILAIVVPVSRLMYFAGHRTSFSWTSFTGLLRPLGVFFSDVEYSLYFCVSIVLSVATLPIVSYSVASSLYTASLLP